MFSNHPHKRDPDGVPDTKHEHTEVDQLTSLGLSDMESKFVILMDPEESNEVLNMERGGRTSLEIAPQEIDASESFPQLSIGGND